MDGNFYKYLSEELYGEEYTRHDTTNLKKKLAPVFEGDKILSIGDKKHSTAFMETFYLLWESNNEKREQLQYYRDKVKEIKKDNNDYDYINELYQNKLQEFVDYKNDCDKKLKDELEKEICNTDIYKKLKHESDRLRNLCEVIPKLNNEITNLKHKNAELCISNSQDCLELKEQNDNMRSKLSKTLRTKITRELEKEHKDEIKILKDKIKVLTKSLLEKELSD